MDAILAEIGKALAGFFGSPVVQFVIYSIAVYLVVLWLASAYWVFRDMQQRTENAILPYLAASLVIVFLPVFPLAIFVYKIIRPHEKIGEVYERNLAEEALLAEVEAIKSCPTCARRVNDEWIICPTCRTRLNRVCPNCCRLVGPRLVAVRLVRQGLRAARRGDRVLGRPARADLAAAGAATRRAGSDGSRRRSRSRAIARRSRAPSRRAGPGRRRRAASSPRTRAGRPPRGLTRTITPATA